MTLYWSVLLGAVQGITEVLPISSTAHLILFPWFFQMPDQGLTFDVALHVGSLLAVIIAFWPQWQNLLWQGLSLPKSKMKPTNHDQKMVYYLLAATIPGALAGFFLEDIVESTLRSPLIIVFSLIFFGLVLIWIENKGAKTKSFDKITLKNAVIIGVAQAIALVPGTSRSGITITAGLAQGLKKEEAAKFSFMLSAPVILGAAITKIPDVSTDLLRSFTFWGGVLSSFLFGLLAIKFILKFVQKKSYRPFVYYRFALATAIIILLIWRG
jgi:undecaprenyl-diphosphatase